MGKQGTPPPVTGALSGSTGSNERMNKMTTTLGFNSDTIPFDGPSGGSNAMSKSSTRLKPLVKSNTDVKKSNTEIISDELEEETKKRTGTGSIYDESTWTI